MSENEQGNEGPTQDTSGMFKPENSKYALRHILHKMDKSVSDTPYTAVKYLTNNSEIESLSWNDRADFEYFLLNYDVDKRSEVAGNIMSLRKMIAGKSLMAGFDFKRDGLSGTATKIVGIIIVLCILWFVICIIIIIVMFFLQQPSESSKPYRRFISTFLICMIFIAIFMVFYNMVITKIMNTQETL